MPLPFQGTWSTGLNSDADFKEKVNYWNGAVDSLLTIKNYYTGCYGSYFANPSYINTNHFLFSFHSIPTWYPRLINKFNKRFKNIKYEVLAERPVYIYQNGWDTLAYSSKSPGNYIGTAKQVLFTINFNKNYTGYSKYYLQYFLHHFIRLISYSEGFVEYSTPEHPKKDDSLTYVLGLNNKNPGYRSLVEGEITYQEFMLLDNIEIVNNAFKDWKYSDHRQTEIMGRVVLESKIDFKHIFKVGDFVRGNTGSPYSVVNENLIRARVIEVMPYNRVKILVIKYPKYISYEGQEFTVTDSTLSLIEKENKND